MKRKRVIIVMISASLLVVAALVFFAGKHMILWNAKALPAIDSISPEPPVLMFGLPVDSFNLETGIIRRNQILAQLLGKYNLPDGAMGQLVMLSKDKFDMRKIRAGNAYTLFLTRDTNYVLKYMVYEHSPIDFTIFDFTDSLRVYDWKKVISTVEKRVNGKIESSLWNTITEQNINPMLALELSDIYAWTIDFFGIQPGDSFSIVYDEMFVDNSPIGIGQIHAAYFRQNGREYYAIPFIQDNIRSYFDADGSSLRRAFLKAPLHFRRISSRFSHSRLHPILRIRRPHHGVDYAAPIGTPVYSIGDGKVIETGYKGGAGRMVKIRHNSLYTTVYMHLSGYGKGIHSGGSVRQGDVIGYVGSSGLSSGPHLDFRVYKNGSPIDPLKMVSPPVEPVKPQNLQAFDSVKSITIKRLMPEEDEIYKGILKPFFEVPAEPTQ